MKTYITKLKLSWMISLSLIGMLSISCDDRLEFDPESFIVDDFFYNNTEEVGFAVIGIYNSLYDIMEFEWVITELRSDNTFMNIDSSSSSDTPLRSLDRFEATSLNENVEGYYRACYRTIKFANIVLQNLDVVTDPDLRNQYEGEARFFRAYAHFNLVRLYGPVPLIDRVLTPQDDPVSRSPESVIYTGLILPDLKEAADLLPTSTEDLGRLTSWAAKGMLAKALLTNKEYTEAISYLEDIKDNGPNSLLTNYADVFDINNEYNNEILFAVRYQSGQVGLGSGFPNLFAPVQSDDFVVTGGGDAKNVPTEGISLAYGVDDQRKAASMSDSWFGANGVENFRKYINKYNHDFTAPDDAGTDWVVLRYADVLLMLAEAYNESSNTSNALPLLNEVRERAGETPLTATEAGSFFTFKLALESERRLEFAFENHRWFDLLRTGRAIAVMNQHFTDINELQYTDPNDPTANVTPLQEWELFLPIPQYEIDLNPNIAQNAGY